jgi:hypothetical protein
MKKVICALCTLILLITAAYAALADEAVAQPAADAPAGTMRSGQVIFALTTGQPSKETDPPQRTISAWLVQGLLSQYLGTETAYSCMQVRSESPALANLPALQSPQHIAAADTLSLVNQEILGFDLAAYSATQVQNAYKDTLQKLLAYVRQGDSGGDYAPPADIWWIDWYETPLTLAAGSVIPAEGALSDDPQVNVYLDMQALLDLVPDLQFHFVYLSNNKATQTAGTSQPADGQAGVPLSQSFTPAELLRNQPQYAKRVTVDTVSSSSLALAAPDVQRILQAQLHAIVDNTSGITVQAQADAPGAWTYLYHYVPADETGDVLLIPPDFSGDSVTIRQIKPLAQAAAEQTGVSGTEPDALYTGHCVLPSPENPCFILLKDISAGDYQIDLVQASPADKPPLVKAYKLIPARSVTLSLVADAPAADSSAAVGLYRDSNDAAQAHTVTVETDATDIPADQWALEILSGDAVLSLPAPPELATDTETAALYRWRIQLPVHSLGQFSLQAKLTYTPADASTKPFILRSIPVTVRVLNRLPETVQGADTLFPLVTDLPDSDGNQPFTIDLNTLFTDADGDPLTYAITSPQSEDTPFEIQGNILTYTPIAGSSDVSVTVRASDGAVVDASAAADAGANSPAEVALTIHQVSAGDTLLGLRFLPDMGCMEHAAQQEPDTYAAITGTEIALAYRLAVGAPLLDLLKTASQTQTFTGGTAALLDTLVLQPNISANEGDVAPVTVEKSIDTGTGDLLVTLRMEPQYRSASLSVQLDAIFGKLALPDLFPRSTLIIGNSAPYLLGEPLEPMRFACDIEDYPWQNATEQIPLSAILADRSVNLSDYFTDRETSALLTYTVAVSGTAKFSWLENGMTAEIHPSEEPLMFTVRTAADGSAPMTLTVLSPGVLSLVITAHDEEYASDNTLQMQIEIQSLFGRLLWIVGLSVLLAGLLLTGILIVRYILKPAYQELQVSVLIRDADADTAEQPAGFFPLKPLKKHGISLYTLMLNFMQPPLRNLDAKDTDAMVLYPSHKGIAVLKLATKTPVRVTPAVRLNSTTYLLTQSRIEIEPENLTGETSAGERILLFFQGKDDVQAAAPANNTPSDDALWDR